MQEQNILVSIAQKQVQFYQNGKRVTEKVECWRLLVWLYTTWLGTMVRRILTCQVSARIVGLYQKSPFSRKSIRPFIEKHGINLDDYEKSIDQFSSFHDFFIRTLKPHVRNIDRSHAVLTSPGDGKLLVIPHVTRDSRFFVKGVTCDMHALLGDAQVARQYVDGTLLMLRLAPYDYHRFHMPVNAMCGQPQIIAGRYESVNPLVFMRGVQPLVSNYRVLIPLETEQWGSMLMVAVGALFVGSIVTTFIPGKQYNRGDEVGYFAFGGSTVIVLCPKNIFGADENFVKHSQEGFETAVVLGQRLGILI